MVIVKYIDSMNIIVEFQDEFKLHKKTTYHNFKTHNVANPYDRTVCGVGYIGEGNYTSGTKHNKDFRYETWSRMMTRCYNPYTINKPSGMAYIDCTVCEEWHNFQNFAKWYDENYYEIPGEKMCLDKDILVKGNKIYSPDTCVFLPERINILIKKQSKSKNGTPTGVLKNKRGQYETRCTVSKDDGSTERVFLGVYNTEKEALSIYNKTKKEEVERVGRYYKQYIPENAYICLLKHFI